MASSADTPTPPVNAATDAITTLLTPYADDALPGRVLDVPPAVGQRLLALLPDDMRRVRPNGSQPSMEWLVAQAAEFEARLVGGLVPARSYARIDGIQLDVDAAPSLAARVAAAWPATGDTPGALEDAVAEAWSAWTAREPIWTGAGTDLLIGTLPAGAAVVGLWWD
jgi:hypothetical protein